MGEQRISLHSALGRALLFLQKMSNLDDWNEKFLMSHKSLGFHLKEHVKIFEKELLPMKRLSVSEIDFKVSKKITASARKLGLITLKIMIELRLMLGMLKSIDLSQEEYDDILINETIYLDSLGEIDGMLKEKIRKFGVIKYLRFYQDRYDLLCAGVCGKNKSKVNIDNLFTD